MRKKKKQLTYWYAVMLVIFIGAMLLVLMG
jgi:maltodextrin utilization protein YvdJ